MRRTESQQVDLSGVEARTLELARSCVSLVAPPPRLTVSEWADERRMLPRTSAEPGRWRTDRTPYLRAVMDACSDPLTKKVVLMFASQTGKSECVLNIAGYYMDYDPTAMMIIQPTVEMAESFSKERLAPMLKDTPSLAERVADPRSRDSNNTILRKEYPGGYVVLIGANAPAGLASRPIRILLSDEIDRYPVSAGTEGDPLSLAEKRQTTYWNALAVAVSTPTVKGESRIASEYENSTREQWCVACPSCGEWQPLEWGRLVFPESGKRRAESGEPGTDGGEVDAESVDPEGVPGADEPTMVCRGCGVMHAEYEWKGQPGRWIARAAHATRGFHLNAMASPWLSWASLIDEFRDAKSKGPEVLKTFINTRLAECWEESGEALDEDILAARRHYYNCDVPDQVTWLTAGVDVQKDRLELEVVGWGLGKESWGIEYRVIPGDPHEAPVWDELDQMLQKTYTRADGVVLPISCTAVDSGFATTAVYAFTRPRYARYIFAIKGQGGPGQPIVAPVRRVGKNKDVPLFPVGTDAGKDLLLSRLQMETEGPGYCHYPRETELACGGWRGYTQEYFAGLMSEHRVERRSMGRVYHTWAKRGSRTRNEPLDCRVYATAALEIRNADLTVTAAVRRSVAGPAAGQHPGARPRRRVISRGVN